MNGPVQVFTAIALILLPTVMFGGFSLLRLLVARRLNEFQVAYFRAGHAHAGVAARAQPGRARPAPSYQPVPDRAMDRRGVARGRVLAQSGGRFVHIGIGKPGQWSAGNTLSSVGAVLLAGALLTTGAAVIAS